MDTFFPLKEWARSVAVRPIDTIEATSSRIKVSFQDGSSEENSLDAGLRMFFIIMKNVKLKPVTDEKVECIPSKLNHFKLLGYQSGEKVLCERNRLSAPIQLS